MKKFILTILLGAIVFTMRPNSFAGNESGGVDWEILDIKTLKLLIEEDHLKKAMVNYLKTIRLDLIEDANVKATFTRMLQGDRLLNDINIKDNYYVGDSCTDSLNNGVFGSAQIGEVGGKICFNGKAIAEEFADLAKEEVFIRLASLALHEHVHHFQSSTINMQDNEDEAYQLAAYVLITAKFVQVPLLHWTTPGSGVNIGSATIKADREGDVTGAVVCVNNGIVTSSEFLNPLEGNVFEKYTFAQTNLNVNQLLEKAVDKFAKEYHYFRSDLEHYIKQAQQDFLFVPDDVSILFISDQRSDKLDLLCPIKGVSFFDRKEKKHFIKRMYFEKMTPLETATFWLDRALWTFGTHTGSSPDLYAPIRKLSACLLSENDCLSKDSVGLPPPPDLPSVPSYKCSANDLELVIWRLPSTKHDYMFQFKKLGNEPEIKPLRNIYKGWDEAFLKDVDRNSRGLPAGKPRHTEYNYEYYSGFPGTNGLIDYGISEVFSSFGWDKNSMLYATITIHKKTFGGSLKCNRLN